MFKMRVYEHTRGYVVIAGRGADMRARAGTSVTARVASLWFVSAVLGCCGFCGIILGGCTPPPPPQHPPAELHISGVRLVPNVIQLEQRVHVDEILGVTTYAPAHTGEDAHVLFALSSTLYDVQLDGSNLRQIASQCSDPGSVTHDGSWQICRADGGITLLDLHSVTAAQPANSNRLLADTADERFSSPTWSSDGRDLAVLKSGPHTCDIQVYAVSLPAYAVRLQATLNLSATRVAVPDGTACNVSSFAWSSDGTLLSFTAGVASTQLYVLPIASLLKDASERVTPAPTVAVTDAILVALGDTSEHSSPVWVPGSHRLTYVSLDGWSIVQADLVTGDVSTVLTQHEAGIFAISWTPDGQHLVFVLGTPGALNTVPPFQLYSYTPSSQQR